MTRAATQPCGCHPRLSRRGVFCAAAAAMAAGIAPIRPARAA